MVPRNSLDRAVRVASAWAVPGAPLSPSLGWVIEGGGRPLRALPTAALELALGRHGAVLLRGFELGEGDFMALTQRLAGRFLSHGVPSLRPTSALHPTVAEVLVGSHPISLHGEMNYSPRRPETLFFYCREPARTGGQTTLACGRAVLAALPAGLRSEFRRRRICYHHVIAPEAWRRVSGVARRSHCLLLMNLQPGMVARAGPSETIRARFVTSAIRRVGWRRDEVFVNSIANIEEYRQATGITVDFADGAPIGADIVAAIRASGESVTVDVPWRAGDVLVVDNRRVMHGRRAFTGPRKILVRFGRRRALSWT